MSRYPIYYRLRIRNASNTADEFVWSSVPSDAAPFIAGPPQGDGSQLDTQTGTVTVGSYRLRISDPIVGPNRRSVTAALADASARGALIARRAFIEQTPDRVTWGNLIAGFVNHIELSTPSEFEFTIGETERVESDIKVFLYATQNLPGATCALGGPVVGGWGPLRDFGAPRFVVKAVDTTALVVKMQFKDGPLPPVYPFYVGKGGTGQGLKLDDGAVSEVNNANSSYYKSSQQFRTTSDTTTHDGWFPRMAASFSDTHNALMSGGTGIPLTTIPFFLNTGATTSGPTLTLQRRSLMDSDGNMWFYFPQGLPAGLTVAAECGVTMYPIDISAKNPLHFQGHPVDFAAALYADANMQTDAQSITDTKNAIGPELAIMVRTSTVVVMQQALEQYCFGPFGIGRRVSTNGLIQFFATRARDSNAPTVTVTENQMRGNGDSKVWTQDQSSMITKVTFKTKTFRAWNHALDGNSVPPDKVYEGDDTTSATSRDNPLAVQKELTYQLDAAIFGRDAAVNANGFVTTMPNVDYDGFVLNVATEIFDRQGRGQIEGDLECTRDVTVKVGDLFFCDVSFIPGANTALSPTSQRGVERVVQCTKRTEMIDGPDLHFVDAGTSDQPSHIPTITAALSTVDGRRFATVSVTNSAQLFADGTDVDLQYTFADPPTFGTPLTLIPKEIIVTHFIYGTVECTSGFKISFRARGRQAGRTPSAWSSWVSLTFAGLGAPGGFTFTDIDSGRGTLAWTPAGGQADLGFALYKRHQSDPAAADQLIATLPAGTRSYLVAGLEPSTNYTFSIQNVLLIIGVGTKVTCNGTTSGSGPAAVPPPKDIRLFVGDSFPAALGPTGGGGFHPPPPGIQFGTGTIGLDVTATTFPSQVTMEMATETAIGSGTPGAYVPVATVRAVLPTSTDAERTRLSTRVPNDGLKRWLRAYASAVGFPDSSTTLPLVVQPWAAQAPAGSVDHPAMGLDTGWIEDFASNTGYKLTTTNATVSFSTGGLSVIRYTPSNVNNYLQFNNGTFVPVDGRQYRYLVTRYRIPTPSTAPVTAKSYFWTTARQDFTVGHDHLLIADGDWHVLVEDMWETSDWNGVNAIEQLMIHLADSLDVIDIDYVAICKKSMGVGGMIDSTATLKGSSRHLVSQLDDFLPNEDFEIWDTNVFPHMWAVDQSHTTWARDTNSWTGNFALKATNPGISGTGGPQYATTQDVERTTAFNAPLKAGQAYRVQVAAQTDMVLASLPRVWLKIDCQNGTPITLSQVFQSINSYGVYEFFFTLPGDAAAFSSIAIGADRGTYTALTTNFWFDSMRVVENTLSSSILDENGSVVILPKTAQQFDGTTYLTPTKGYQQGFADHGAVVSLPIGLQSPPAVEVDPTVSVEPESLWGTDAQIIAQSGNTTAYNTALRTYMEYYAINVTATQFTIRARLRQPGTVTNRTITWSGTVTVTGNGSLSPMTISNAPSQDDRYTLNYGLVLTTPQGPPVFGG